MFQYAITRPPCPRITEGITTAKLGKPDYEKALSQHQNYVNILKQLGLEIIMLEANNNFPDSTFVEDVILYTPKVVILTNPGAASRKGETALIAQMIQERFEVVEKIIPPGTIEAGDIMRVGDDFYIGLSERSNKEGIRQLIVILERYGMKGIAVPMQEMLHLKTGISYLENNNLLVCGEFIHHDAFKHFNKIVVEEEEAYAANSLWVNGTVIVPAGFPKTRLKIEALGYPVVTVDVSEFQKVDGGLSCLSVRF